MVCGAVTRRNDTPSLTCTANTLSLVQAYCDYTTMMELTQDLVVGAAEEVGLGSVISYQGAEVDLTPPWRRVSMHELVSRAGCW